MGDEVFVRFRAVGRVWLVGKEPCLSARFRVYQGYAHAVGKHPNHAEVVGIDVLHLCHRLAWALHVDELGFKVARVVDYQPQVGGYEQLVAGVLELVDACNAFWHRNHDEFFSLIESGEFAVGCSQEDVSSHLSNPFEWEGCTEVVVVDGGSLFGENPLTAFLVTPDIPYFSASQTVFSHLDEFSADFLLLR